MKKKKIAAMLVVAFTVSMSSNSPIMGADDITKYDCDYKPKLTAGLSNYLENTWKWNRDIEFYSGWTTTELNIRSSPNTNSEVITTLPFNTMIRVADFNKEWDMINIDGKIYYVSKQYISEVENTFSLIEVPYAANKTWMSYKAITSKSSKQYKLQYGYAYTGNHGIRMAKGRYCVALGSYFNCDIGQYFDLILENGTVIPCVMADMKADNHTDSNNIITVSTNCLSEFIVDQTYLNNDAKTSGNISNICSEWATHVTQIKVYEKFVW